MSEAPHLVVRGSLKSKRAGHCAIHSRKTATSDDDEEKESTELQEDRNFKTQSDSEDMSSRDNESEIADIDEAEIRLAQMRRTAMAERGIGKGSNMASKFSDQKSFEDMHREHALKRMTEGVRTILQMHTHYELSSICG